MGTEDDLLFNNWPLTAAAAWPAGGGGQLKGN